MKSRPFFLLILFFFNSCLVIKIYESPEPKTKDPEKPQQVRRELIGSGKIIELGQGGSQEILFFDQENIPKGYLFEEDATVKEGQQVDTSMIWINSDKKENSKIKSREIKFVKDVKIQSNLSPSFLVNKETNKSLKKIIH